MIVKNEPYLIEYNVRMGDPECQTILPKLKTDITDIFLACCEEKLEKIDIEWKNNHNYKQNQIIIFNDSLIYANKDFRSVNSIKRENWSNYTKHN